MARRVVRLEGLVPVGVSSWCGIGMLDTLSPSPRHLGRAMISGTTAQGSSTTDQVEGDRARAASTARSGRYYRPVVPQSASTKVFALPSSGTDEQH